MTPEIIRAQRDHERRLAYEETLETADAISYALIVDRKTQGTVGGTFTSGAWRTRDLNTEITDTDGIVSVAANQFTLAAGTYIIRASAPAYLSNSRHGTRMRNITDGTTDLFGTSEFSFNDQTRSFIAGKLILTASKTFELQHQTAITSVTYGLGVETNMQVETYAMVEIWKMP